MAADHGPLRGEKPDRRGVCATEGIGSSAFWRWRRRLADEDAARGRGGPAFVELSGAGTAAWDAELDLGAGVVLRVRRRQR